MTQDLKTFDAAEFLDTEEDIHHYLDACLETGDPRLVAAALGDIARARNMTQLAKDVGMTRAGLYKALSAEGNPGFATIMRVAKALGFEISFQPAWKTPQTDPI